MKFFQPKPGERHNLLHVAFNHFPGSFFKSGVGVLVLAAPFLLNYFSQRGINSIVERVLLNGLLIVIIPASLLFFLTLIRAPGIRRRKEAEMESELLAANVGLDALKIQEIKEEKEIVRLKQVVTGDRNARRVKDKKEKKRWDSLIEWLRVQEATGQQNIDLKEKREDARRELASEERLLVAQQVKDIKDEDDIARKELVSDRLIAQGVKDIKEDERWNILHERLRIQEEKSEERDRDQLRRDEEFRQMRNDDHLRNQYKTLLVRYIRHAEIKGMKPDVADGLAPIPVAWLKDQPEIRKTPALMLSLVPYNER